MTKIFRIQKIWLEYTGIYFILRFATSDLISVCQHCDFELPTGLCVSVNVLAHMLLTAIADTIAVQTVIHLVLGYHNIIFMENVLHTQICELYSSRSQYYNFSINLQID